MAEWLHNATRRNLTEQQRQVLETHLKPFEAANSRAQNHRAAHAAPSPVSIDAPLLRSGATDKAFDPSRKSCDVGSSVPTTYDVAIDRERCLARVLSVGVARQCARPPCKNGSPFCRQHAKNQPHGTML